MDKLATMGTIGSSFRPWLSCQGLCVLNRHQTGDTDSVQLVILLPGQRDSQETFLPCEARMLWYSADRTSSQQLRDTTGDRRLSLFVARKNWLKISASPPCCSANLVKIEGHHRDLLGYMYANCNQLQTLIN